MFTPLFCIDSTMQIVGAEDSVLACYEMPYPGNTPPETLLAAFQAQVEARQAAALRELSRLL
jgi:hypothetical protein